MITRYIKTPLGNGGIEGSPRKKEWLPIVMAAASVASSIYGGVKASQAAKDAERKQRAQEAKESAWYNRRYNESYLDTAAGQNLVRRAKDYARENWRKAAGAQAVAGGTEAATAQAKDAGNKMVGDTIANIAAQDTARKDHVDDLHRQQEQQFMQMDIARENQRAQNISTAAQNASNALMQGASAAMNLAGGSNNSVKVDKVADGVTRNAGLSADGGTINLQSNVAGIGGEYDVNELRRLIGAPS